MNYDPNDELQALAAGHVPDHGDSSQAVDSPTPAMFPPSAIFYDSPGGFFLVDMGRVFFRWSRKTPVVNGVARWRMKNGDHADLATKAAKQDVANRELDGAVQWSGSIAGHKRGIQSDHDGLPILITSEANIPAPIAGPMPIISSIIRQAFPDADPRAVFLGWLSLRFRAVREGIHTPAPMMVLAGEVNTGKSLLAWLVGQTLGGRIASPHAAWSGGMLWNDDLVHCELLLIDDAVGSTDIRSRRNFGAAFKEAIYGPIVQLRKRHTSSISVRPVWSVMLCCNSTPESLQIVPPLDADLSDKVALLRAAPITPPIDTSSPEGRAELQRAIRSELPALAASLLTFTVPEHLRDSRSGILAWRDPDLAEAVEATSPARRLEELLSAALVNRGVWFDLPAILTAAEIEARLTDHGSTVREQARNLFHWHGACGAALARLARGDSRHVELAEPDGHAKRPRYRVKP
jgi:hypothetical protein